MYGPKRNAVETEGPATRRPATRAQIRLLVRLMEEFNAAADLSTLDFEEAAGLISKLKQEMKRPEGWEPF